MPESRFISFAYPVAIRMTWKALPMTWAGRLAPVGVLGMAEYYLENWAEGGTAAMAKISNPYVHIIAESYRDKVTGSFRLRPARGQRFPRSLRIHGCRDCSRYPIGTRFRLKVKLTDVNGSDDYLYTSWQWPFEVLRLGAKL